MEENFKLDKDGMPTDVLLSLRKLFILINQQIKYYKEEQQKIEENASYYIFKSKESKNEWITIQDKIEEWEWLQQHLTERWDTYLIN